MSPHRAAGIGSILLGTGIAAGAILGPLAFRVIAFRTSRHIENQFVGGEVVSLGLVAPTLIAAGVLWVRRHRLAPAVALGPALYAVYTYTTAVLGQEYARYPGNVEQFFPLYAGLVAGGVAIAGLAWSRLGEGELPEPSDGLRRSLAATFLALGGFFALAWAAQIRLVLMGTPSAEYREGPTLFWLIKFLDCGFVIPALVATGVGLVRRRPLAVRAAYALAPFGTCLVGSVAAVAIAMEVKGDPSSEPAMLAIALPAAVGLAVATGRLLETYRRSTTGGCPAVSGHQRGPRLEAEPM
jgi:hypothetical protein